MLHIMWGLFHDRKKRLVEITSVRLTFVLYLYQSKLNKIVPQGGLIIYYILQLSFLHLSQKCNSSVLALLGFCQLEMRQVWTPSGVVGPDRIFISMDLCKGIHEVLQENYFDKTRKICVKGSYKMQSDLP